MPRARGIRRSSPSSGRRMSMCKRFRDRGIEPEGFVLYTYAALQAWTQAAQAAGTTDMEGVIKALNENGFDTVIGKFRFNQKDDPNLPLMPSISGLTEATRRSAMRPRHLPVRFADHGGATRRLSGASPSDQPLNAASQSEDTS